MGNALLMLAVIAVMTSVLLYKFHFYKKHKFLLLGSPRLRPKINTFQAINVGT